ncbi:MAG: flagellar M-ring protein FliF [Acidobacteria bacterium]|nr:flagellar M-ring protein FliF [Acidobacteriota bacterium]
MNPQQIISRLNALFASLTITQRVTLAGTFVAVAALVIGFAYWIASPSYRLLFADMDPEAAADVVSRLKAQKVPYHLDDGGRAIRVPASRVDELRLDFSSNGLPSSGRIGFEIFDRTAFGATEFLEQVNYRRALEGEIARTIATIAEVGGARVHLALPKQSLFGEREQPAKASVVVKLKGNRPLAPATVRGITSLVAASVEGLRPEAVVVLDSFGRPLARPSDDPQDADSPTAPEHLERQHRIERELAVRLVSLLEPVVGVNRVRVNVMARLSTQTTEQTEERWDPSTAVVRSRQVSAETGAASRAQGVAGARANMPQPGSPSDQQPAAPPASAAAPGRNAETTNYEISKVTTHTVRPRGDLARLSVAVILDEERVVSRDKAGVLKTTTKPRDRAELQKLHSLVAAAAGFDASRGDQLTVESVPFEEPIVDDVLPPTMTERYGPPLLEVGKVIVVLLLVVGVLLYVVRPVMERATAVASRGGVKPAAVTSEQSIRTVQELEGAIEAELEAEAAAKAGELRRLPVLSKRISGMTKKQPEHAARLLRAWLAEDKR